MAGPTEISKWVRGVQGAYSYGGVVGSVLSCARSSQAYTDNFASNSQPRSKTEVVVRDSQVVTIKVKN